MFKNYFKTAVRNVWKHKTFSFINITGLTVGLTSFILIALFIFDEFTFDRIHTNADNIYRVVESKTSAEGKTSKRSGTGFLVSARAKAAFPEIRDVARISTYWRAEIKPGNQHANIFHEYVTAGNPGFLNVFSYPLLYGHRSSALTEPRSVILTEETAQKFFGRTDAVGELLFFDNDSVPFKVTGILKNFPANSSISYNLLISESTILGIPEAQKHFSGDWTSGAFATYFLLNNNTDISALNTSLDNLIASNHTPDPGVKSQVQLQPLKDIHFYSNDIEGNSGKKGNVYYVCVFLIVACFIIFIACINYMNLSTARFTNRGKEIAVRKVAGASRTTLIKQFLTEALLVTIFSVLLSLMLVVVLLPAFNSFTEKHLTLNIHTDYRIWAGIFFMIAVVALSAGLYPALFQSGLNPLSLLKGKIQLGRGNISLRRSLVVFQFVISIVLIAATIIIYQQMQYVNDKDMGFDKDKVVVIDINSGYVRRSAATIKDEFAKLAQVKSVSVTSTVPGAWKTIPVVKVNTDNSNPTSGKDMYYFGVDGQFLSTYNIELLKGRNFFPSGNADADAVLINETAAKAFGIKDALDQPVTILSAKFGGDSRSAVEKPFTVNIAGIVKDFNFQSLHEPIAPMMMGFNKTLGADFGYLTVKFAGGDVDGLLKKMNAILHRVDQTHLFEYHFLDKQWDLLYRDDKIRQTIFLVVSLLAIFIAALGLLGLTIYAAEQRVKEIGIRKVLGAKVSSIVLMLSKDFLKLVLIAALVAIPVAWLFMHKWLEDFAYRINISLWVFVLSALVAVVIAMATIGLQVIKAAIANPVKSLRTE
ncbi:ABC transporter permease [Agriterribacter sp.]|uniref:ABC transporter permease n=1 Tax=Agriterribacter sp. TaxID=2821509 RepID=UPI002C331299|nr:ABC transporter permease [Agriterribacter sp.]HRP56359.1 ABC transporter permease [Agriterribacter sp.]